MKATKDLPTHLLYRDWAENKYGSLLNNPLRIIPVCFGKVFNCIHLFTASFAVFLCHVVVQ